MSKVKAYRLELQNHHRNFVGVNHYNTLELAEAQLKRHSYLVEYNNNITPSNKRYGTIWETTLKT